MKAKQKKKNLAVGILKMVTVMAVIAGFIYGIHGVFRANALFASSSSVQNFSAIGTVNDIDAGSLSITSGDTSYVFDTSSVTEIETKSYEPLTLSDINIGDKVIVQGTSDSGSIAIKRIISFSSVAVLATTTVSTVATTTTMETATSTDVTVSTISTGESASSTVSSTTEETISTTTDSSMTATSTDAMATSTTDAASSTLDTSASSTDPVTSSSTNSVTPIPTPTPTSTPIVAPELPTSTPELPVATSTETTGATIIDQSPTSNGE